MPTKKDAVPKNIIVCSDGTGNSGFKNRGTNVYKLFEAVDVHWDPKDPNRIEQFKVYDDGVGTQKMKLLRYPGLAFGFGLRRNVFQLYEAIARAYQSGDQIYLFGFSRGAFTVRMLAGFICACGLTDVKKVEREGKTSIRQETKFTWKLYRQRYSGWLERVLGLKTKENPYELGALDRMTSGRIYPPIRFIGVWDTVGAYGVPYGLLSDFIDRCIVRFSFNDMKLDPNVEYARQALAMDDERKTFRPNVWVEDPEDAERIRQVWFPGMHADVGGGYPKHGLSLLALDWMIEELQWIAAGGKTTSNAPENSRTLQNRGIKWVDADRESIAEHSNSDDVIHNSRSGPAVYYRYCPRDIEALWSMSANTSVPRIHDSAVRRIRSRTEGYSPRALPLRFQTEVTGDRASWKQITLDGASTARTECARWIKLRCWSQYFLYLSTVVFLGIALAARFEPLGIILDSALRPLESSLIHFSKAQVLLAGFAASVFISLLIRVTLYPPRYSLQSFLVELLLGLVAILWAFLVFRLDYLQFLRDWLYAVVHSSTPDFIWNMISTMHKVYPLLMLVPILALIPIGVASISLRRRIGSICRAYWEVQRKAGKGKVLNPGD